MIFLCSIATYLWGKKQRKEREVEEKGNPTTNARNFQFLVCFNDSFSFGILFHKKNHTKKNGNLRLFSQWKVQQRRLPISRKCNRVVGARTTRRGLGHGICDQPYYDHCNSLRHIGHYWHQ